MTQFWPQRERARELLAKEVGYVSKPHGGRMRVALAFPNTYFVGMSNLGFQTVYTLFNAQDDIVCERVFLPPKSELAAQLASRAPALTLESQTPVRDFDILAFSVSFEWDYTNVITLLRLAGLPPRASERTHHDPLVMIGGVRSSRRNDAGLIEKPISSRVVRILSISGWSQRAIETRPAFAECARAARARSRIRSALNARTGR
jgi:hypothetical protein